MRIDNTPPATDEFERYLELAINGEIASDTGLPNSVQSVLNEIFLNGSSPDLIDKARKAFQAI